MTDFATYEIERDRLVAQQVLLNASRKASQHSRGAKPKRGAKRNGTDVIWPWNRDVRMRLYRVHAGCMSKAWEFIESVEKIH
jgi:hypothetical protein